MNELPEQVERSLERFVAAVRAAFDDHLRAIVLFGSGAEGRLRATSDVNVIVVLTAFERTRAERLMEPLRMEQAIIRLSPMFLLDSEVAAASEAFAVKFSDVAHRHRVLFGADPFAHLKVPRAAAIARLRQALLNLRLRLRGRYLMRGLRPEQLSLVIADATGPLRSCAASLLELEGQGTFSPREALERFIAHKELLRHLSETREHKVLSRDLGGDVLFELLALLEELEARAERLAP